MRKEAGGRRIETILVSWLALFFLFAALAPGLTASAQEAEKGTEKGKTRTAYFFFNNPCASCHEEDKIYEIFHEKFSEAERASLSKNVRGRKGLHHHRLCRHDLCAGDDRLSSDLHCQRFLLLAGCGDFRQGRALAGGCHAEGVQGGVQESEDHGGHPQFRLLHCGGHAGEHCDDDVLRVSALPEGIWRKKQDRRVFCLHDVFQRRTGADLHSGHEAGTRQFALGDDHSDRDEHLQHDHRAHLYGKLHSGRAL